MRNKKHDYNEKIALKKKEKHKLKKEERFENFLPLYSTLSAFQKRIRQKKATDRVDDSIELPAGSSRLRSQTEECFQNFEICIPLF